MASSNVPVRLLTSKGNCRAPVSDDVDILTKSLAGDRPCQVILLKVFSRSLYAPNITRFAVDPKGLDLISYSVAAALGGFENDNGEDDRSLLIGH